MTKNAQPRKQPLEPNETVTEFVVNDGGVLGMAHYKEAETRADFYDSVAHWWSRSPKNLAHAMDDCQPLAWAVHSIYSDFRDELEGHLQDAQDAGSGSKRKVAGLTAQLKALAQEPEEGAPVWLMSLTSKEFEDRVVPDIEKWFGGAPNWSFEGDYLPDSGTAQGAALEFFRNMMPDELEALGVDVIEGEHPGSTYYAAKLRVDIDDANRAAEAAGLSIRFLQG